MHQQASIQRKISKKYINYRLISIAAFKNYNTKNKYQLILEIFKRKELKLYYFERSINTMLKAIYLTIKNSVNLPVLSLDQVFFAILILFVNNLVIPVLLLRYREGLFLHYNNYEIGYPKIYQIYVISTIDNKLKIFYKYLRMIS